MDNLTCFVSVEFVDDPNVRGWTYWYQCDFDGAEAGDEAIAPLGRHNGLQRCVIRKVAYAPQEEAPYPIDRIKKIKTLIKDKKDV